LARRDAEVSLAADFPVGGAIVADLPALLLAPRRRSALFSHDGSPVPVFFASTSSSKPRAESTRIAKPFAHDKNSGTATSGPQAAPLNGMVENLMANPSKPLVLVTEGSDPTPLNWLRERAEVVEMGSDDPQFDARLATAAGMVVRTYTKVDESLLGRAPKLRVVGRGGVGLENIDVLACRRRGIEVVYTPDANTLAVGDFVIGYALQLLRPWGFFREVAYDPKEFKRFRNSQRGVQLNELTLGILGMGRVGRRLGHVAANGFGMKVIYNDLLDVQVQLDFPATPVDKPTLYRTADVLSLHVDMRPGNEHLVAREQLATMKPAAILINTSRGEVLDANALADAIRGKKLAGAAIDVFDPEPPKADFPLLGLDNVLLTPHVAARTHTAIANMSWVVRDVIAVLNGERPKYPAPVKQ
jgi:D-3-phosphoglycerate dehydrogenase